MTQSIDTTDQDAVYVVRVYSPYDWSQGGEETDLVVGPFSTPSAAASASIVIEKQARFDNDTETHLVRLMSVDEYLAERTS